jgi:hypothetical protein
LGEVDVRRRDPDAHRGRGHVPATRCYIEAPRVAPQLGRIERRFPSVKRCPQSRAR